MTVRRLLVVAVFAGFATTYLGAVVLDIVRTEAAATVVGGSEAADRLLVLFGLTGLAGVAAVWAAADRPKARNLLILSVALVSLELFVPLLVAGPVAGVEDAVGIRLGPWVRLAAAGGAALTAWLGLWAASRGDATQVIQPSDQGLR